MTKLDQYKENRKHISSFSTKKLLEMRNQVHNQILENHLWCDMLDMEIGRRGNFDDIMGGNK